MKVSSHALSTMNEKHQRVPELLPCTEDLQKLCLYQKAMIAELSTELEDNPSPSVWLELSEHVLARLTIFNKRRGGEASKILVTDFVNRPSWHDGCVQEFQSTLSELEKHLCKTLDLIRVVGKKRRSVPVLLTSDMLNAITLLLQHRSNMGISPENPYLFPRVYGGSLEHLQTWDCLKKISLKAKLKNAERIQTTKLRKYVATVSQVFGLDGVDLDWLARHLGHDISTHREYYRLHDSTVELAKISKLLIAVEKCDPSSWKGKSLDSIDLTSHIVIDRNAEDSSSNDSDCAENVESLEHFSSNAGIHAVLY